jgi:hypothetical protein
VAVAAAPAPALSEAVFAEVRAALRGRTASELAEALGEGTVAVEGALRVLAGAGRLVRRGPRWFVG